MSRRDNFDQLKTHPWFNRVYKQLKVRDLQTCHDFLEVNAQADKNVFALRLERMFLGMPDKPKRWTIIQDLLLAANAKLEDVKETV